MDRRMFLRTMGTGAVCAMAAPLKTSADRIGITKPPSVAPYVPPLEWLTEYDNNIRSCCVIICEEGLWEMTIGRNCPSKAVTNPWVDTYEVGEPWPKDANFKARSREWHRETYAILYWVNNTWIPASTYVRYMMGESAEARLKKALTPNEYHVAEWPYWLRRF